MILMSACDRRSRRFACTIFVPRGREYGPGGGEGRLGRESKKFGALVTKKRLCFTTIVGEENANVVLKERSIVPCPNVLLVNEMQFLAMMDDVIAYSSLSIQRSTPK